MDGSKKQIRHLKRFLSQILYLKKSARTQYFKDMFVCILQKKSYRNSQETGSIAIKTENQ